MSDVYLNRSADLANTNLTTLYTVPTADVTTTPPQKPVQAIVNAIRVTNDSGGAVVIDVVITDASVGADIKIAYQKSIASNSYEELLSRPIVLENSDVLKVQAGGGNALHVVASILEITP
tara:strand:- start:11 stop:370 length:360 start_codon:yes stop_codon:yes gene_type:complete